MDLARLETQLSLVQSQEPTPRLFNYNLIQQAKANPQHIVLPESTEPRILKAASVLRSQHIVNITLLGQRAEIERAIEQHGIQLNLNDLAIVNPATSDKMEEYARTVDDIVNTVVVTAIQAQSQKTEREPISSQS